MPKILQDFFNECIIPICKDKRILDLTCGAGSSGHTAIRHGAKFVRFADARTEVIQPPPSTNYEIKFIDLNFPAALLDILSDIDLTFYIGHLYHASNHASILEYLYKSNCKEFLIETKIKHLDLNFNNPDPEILWVDEDAIDILDQWNNTHSRTLIGKPNLSWMKHNLELTGFKIQNLWEFDGIHMDQRENMHYRSYMFHCFK